MYSPSFSTTTAQQEGIFWIPHLKKLRVFFPPPKKKECLKDHLTLLFRHVLSLMKCSSDQNK